MRYKTLTFCSKNTGPFSTTSCPHEKRYQALPAYMYSCSETGKPGNEAEQSTYTLLQYVHSLISRASPSFPLLAVQSKASFPGPHPASRRLQYSQRPRSQAFSQLPVACSTVEGLVPRPSPSFPLLAVQSKASFPGLLPASRRLQYA